MVNKGQQGTTGSTIVLEICANSVLSALAAQSGGADRVELCDNMAEGGTTPAYSTIAKTRELIQLQLYPIIRPRGGDFLYNDLEFELMWKDIEQCKQLGCDGVVIGLLNADGTIDKRRVKLLVELAWPLGVTFHRAFDRCVNPLNALEDIIETGCERILTSGQQSTATEGTDLIAQLVKKADGRITVMAGSGVRENNIAELVIKTHAREYHSTAKVPALSRMLFKNDLAESDETDGFNASITDANLVKKLREKAESALNPTGVQR